MSDLVATRTIINDRPVVRSLAPADLERVVAIDRSIIGHSRKGFFEKRLAASRREPAAFASLGLVQGGAVAGYLLAHFLDGEFGGHQPVAELDAIGVAEEARRHGGAHALLQELKSIARGRGAHELRTEVRLADNHLLHFLISAGFKLSGRLVLDRSSIGAAMDVEPVDIGAETGQLAADNETRVDLEAAVDDAISVRSLMIGDLPIVIGVDRGITGRDRSIYYKRKAAESLEESGIRLSLVAETASLPVGFIMARVDYGEFGQTEPEAVMDTIAVNPDFAGRKIASAMLTQLLGNLAGLRIERLRTEVEWDNLDLLGFLKRLNFQPSQRLSFKLPL